ncbi:hypothetical protein JCM3765_002802 [Sporobolomyces pararoseus]
MPSTKVSSRSSISSVSSSLSRFRDWREARKAKQVDEKQRKIIAARGGEPLLFKDNNAPRKRDLFFRNPFRQRNEDRKSKEKLNTAFVPRSRITVEPRVETANVGTSPPQNETIRPVLSLNQNRGSEESAPSRSTGAEQPSESGVRNDRLSKVVLAQHSSRSSQSSRLRLSTYYNDLEPSSPLDHEVSEPWKRFDERAEAEEERARRRQQDYEEDVKRERAKREEREKRERKEFEREVEESEERQTLRGLSKPGPAFGRDRRGRAPKPIPIRLPPAPGPPPTSPLPSTPSSPGSQAHSDSSSHRHFGSISSFVQTPSIHHATAFQVQHGRQPSGKSILSPKPPSLHRTATINSTRSRGHRADGAFHRDPYPLEQRDEDLAKDTAENEQEEEDEQRRSGFGLRRCLRTAFKPISRAGLRARADSGTGNGGIEVTREFRVNSHRTSLTNLQEAQKKALQRQICPFASHSQGSLPAARSPLNQVENLHRDPTAQVTSPPNDYPSIAKTNLSSPPTPLPAHDTSGRPNPLSPRSRQGSCRNSTVLPRELRELWIKSQRRNSSLASQA